MNPVYKIPKILEDEEAVLELKDFNLATYSRIIGWTGYLANYAANVKPITKVQIEVKSPRKETGKTIIWVKHIVFLKYSKWDHMIQRADGTKQEYVSKHISY